MKCERLDTEGLKGNFFVKVIGDVGIRGGEIVELKTEDREHKGILLCLSDWRWRD